MTNMFHASRLLGMSMKKSVKILPKPIIAWQIPHIAYMHGSVAKWMMSSALIPPCTGVCVAVNILQHKSIYISIYITHHDILLVIFISNMSEFVDSPCNIGIQTRYSVLCVLWLFWTFSSTFLSKDHLWIMTLEQWLPTLLNFLRKHSSSTVTHIINYNCPSDNKWISSPVSSSRACCSHCSHYAGLVTTCPQ